MNQTAINNIETYIKTKLEDKEHIIAWRGVISSEAISNILIELEEKLLKEKISVKLRKKTYNISVECLQNLYHHCIPLPDAYQTIYPGKYAIFYINLLNKDAYMLTTGNFILQPKVKSMSQKIDKINTLTQEDLKEMYKFILNHQKLSARGGGGLGLIDVGRKSGHKLTYEFLELDKDYYFYVLNVKITEE